jgi:hypothetical protein
MTDEPWTLLQDGDLIRVMRDPSPKWIPIADQHRARPSAGAEPAPTVAAASTLWTGLR